MSEQELAEAAQFSSLADETPEGRSIVVLAKQYGVREHDMSKLDARFVPFTAETRMSGVDFDGTRLRKGAGDAVLAWVGGRGRPRAAGAAAPSSTGSGARAARRWPWRGTTRCWA